MNELVYTHVSANVKNKNNNNNTSSRLASLLTNRCSFSEPKQQNSLCELEHGSRAPFFGKSNFISTNMHK